MWEIEEISEFEQLPPSDQLWLIALAVEENGGPTEYIRALRTLADHLDDIRWWLAEGATPPTLSNEIESQWRPQTWNPHGPPHRR